MAKLGWALLLLLGGAWYACEVPAPAEAPPEPTAWRRTAVGWEKSDRWMPPRRHYPPLHPLPVASLQLLLSLLALVSLSPPSRDAASTAAD